MKKGWKQQKFSENLSEKLEDSKTILAFDQDRYFFFFKNKSLVAPGGLLYSTNPNGTAKLSSNAQV